MRERGPALSASAVTPEVIQFAEIRPKRAVANHSEILLLNVFDRFC